MPNKQKATEVLNTEQRKAVDFPSSCSLSVIAGAGSGKTKVLTLRASKIVSEFNNDSSSVLAVTFTNKAASEIKNRLINSGVSNVATMWTGTFHGLSNRFLRKHHDLVGLPKSFQIIDSSDQEKIVKKIFIENDFNKDVEVKDVISFINKCKDKALSWNEIIPADKEENFKKKCYQLYQDKCEASGLVDFGELIVRALKLFSIESIRLKYQDQFKHILVDEFQDTNDAQYELISVLSDVGQAIPVTIVGDMDQSIYSWRGAKMENVKKFINEFPNVEIIKLEVNYRSTPEILAVANSLIKNNSDRIEKNLKPHHGSGDLPILIEANDDREEADIAVRAAINQHSISGKWSDTTIMYRSNAQSRIIEEACIKRMLPYKIHGGLKFFERAEIKDAIAYLSVLSGNSNYLAIERIASVPPKGLGKKFTETSILADRLGISWLDFLSSEHFKLPEKQMKTWAAINQDFTDRRSLASASLNENVKWCIENFGLLNHYKAIDLKEGSDRAQNLMELVSAAKRFSEDAEYKYGVQSINEFLSSIALESEGKEDGDSNKINLMTIHSAKGLEFPVVCAVGWDEGLFPTSRSQSDKSSMEEERRLAYVAVTRAEKKLYITTSIQRMLYGQLTYPDPSRFISEVESLCKWRSKPTRTSKDFPQLQKSDDYSYQSNYSSSNCSHWSVGDSVEHPTLGQGIILRVDGNSKESRVKIQFNNGEVRIVLPAASGIIKI